MIEIRTSIDIDEPALEGVDRKERPVTEGTLVLSNEDSNNPNFVELSVVYEAYFPGNDDVEEKTIFSGTVLVEELYLAMDAFRQLKREETASLHFECGDTTHEHEDEVV